MGGPSRESYLAAQKRREERRDALRTRGGVVDLLEWKMALRAVPGLERLLGDPPWLLGVRLTPAPEVGFQFVVTILRDTGEARSCLPSHVDDIPVTDRRPEPRRPRPDARSLTSGRVSVMVDATMTMG